MIFFGGSSGQAIYVTNPVPVVDVCFTEQHHSKSDAETRDSYDLWTCCVVVTVVRVSFYNYIINSWQWKYTRALHLKV